MRLTDTSPFAVGYRSYLKVRLNIVSTYSADPTTALQVKVVDAKEDRGPRSVDGRGNPKLMVTLKSARGLRNADFTGLSDPYCVCEVPGKPSTRIQTQIVDDK